MKERPPARAQYGKQERSEACLSFSRACPPEIKFASKFGRSILLGPTATCELAPP